MALKAKATEQKIKIGKYPAPTATWWCQSCKPTLTNRKLSRRLPLGFALVSYKKHLKNAKETEIVLGN